MRRTWMTGVVSLLFVLACGCGDSSGSGAGDGGSGADGTTAQSGGSGAGTTTGGGTTVATTTGFPTTTTGFPTTTTSTSAGGDCDPPAPEGSLYALSDINLNDDAVSMCKYRGDVLLIVNVAQA